MLSLVDGRVVWPTVASSGCQAGRLVGKACYVYERLWGALLQEGGFDVA